MYCRIFPELELDKIKRQLGLDVTIVTTATSNDEGRELLALMGMPFSGKKQEIKQETKEIKPS